MIFTSSCSGVIPCRSRTVQLQRFLPSVLSKFMCKRKLFWWTYIHPQWADLQIPTSVYRQLFFPGGNQGLDQAGFEYIWQCSGELCKTSCQVLRIWSGGTPLFRSAHLPATLPPLGTWAVSCTGTSSCGVCLHLIISPMYLHLVQITAPDGLVRGGNKMIKAAQEVFKVLLGNRVVFFFSLCKFPCFFHFLANWAKSPIHHSRTTSLFLMMTVYNKNSSLKWEKLVIRSSRQFQKSYPNSQQLNICPPDFTLLLKWVNSFQSMHDCIENLKNRHCMKKHCLAARDSSHQPEMSPAQASASKQTMTAKTPFLCATSIFVSWWEEPAGSPWRCSLLQMDRWSPRALSGDSSSL